MSTFLQSRHKMAAPASQKRKRHQETPSSRIRLSIIQVVFNLKLNDFNCDHVALVSSSGLGVGGGGGKGGYIFVLRTTVPLLCSEKLS